MSILTQDRGHHHRHGGKDVRHRGAGDRVRHARERRVRRGADVAGIKSLAELYDCGAAAKLRKAFRQKRRAVWRPSIRQYENITDIG